MCARWALPQVAEVTEHLACVYRDFRAPISTEDCRRLLEVSWLQTG